MTNSQLYEAIFRRKSVRKYDMTPLPATTLASLKEFADNAKPLDTSIKLRLSYLGTDEVKNLLPIKAPHYLCLYSEKTSNYLINAGFFLQQLDLYLSASGLGSCWLGMAKPSSQVPREMDGLQFVIMLAFGHASGSVHRASTSEFRRNDMSAITDIPNAAELLEPVRLAPSASNTQPWFFSGSVNEIAVSREKLSLIKSPLYGKMNQIDIGIALCHLYLSLEHQGKKVVFDFDPAPVSTSGYEFMVKAKVVQ